LTAYIVNVYAPTWFTVKYHELAVDGPKNLFFLMARSNEVEDKQAREIAQRCIQRNAFHAHPENILLAQLASPLTRDRLEAVEKVMQARKNAQALQQRSMPNIRLFRVPVLDFNATKWQLMIKWDKTDVYEPPLTKKLTIRDLLAIIVEPLRVAPYKCHTQMVERAVKEVTRAAQQVIGEKKTRCIN